MKNRFIEIIRKIHYTKNSQVCLKFLSAGLKIKLIYFQKWFEPTRMNSFPSGNLCDLINYFFDRFQAEWLPLYPFSFQSAFDERNCFLSRVQLWGIWRDADSFYAFFFHKFLRSGAAVQWCIIKNKAQLCTSIIVLIESISNITNEPSKRFCCNWLISCQNPFQPDWWYPNDKAHCKWIRVDG